MKPTLFTKIDKKMKEFILKIYNNQQINLEELNLFIVDYCKLMNNKIPDNLELSGILQLIQMGVFDLKYACKLAAIKLDIPLNLLYDKHGNLIKVFIP